MTPGKRRAPEDEDHVAPTKLRRPSTLNLDGMARFPGDTAEPLTPLIRPDRSLDQIVRDMLARQNAHPSNPWSPSSSMTGSLPTTPQDDASAVTGSTPRAAGSASRVSPTIAESAGAREKIAGDPEHEPPFETLADNLARDLAEL